MTEKHFTVSELISRLRSFPADAEVILEGCDCYGWWNGHMNTEVDQDGKLSLVIRRYDGVGDD